MTKLRIDKFLCFARLAKSRSIAQGMIEAGHVRLDGERIANQHLTIRSGQILTLTAHGQFRVIEVVTLPARRGPPQEALSCYIEIVSPQVIDVGDARI